MKLWILRPLCGEKEVGPWNPWYDKCFGVVLRASDAALARELAAKNAGDEGSSAWLDSTLVRCDELTADGEAGVVMTDFWSA